MLKPLFSPSYRLLYYYMDSEPTPRLETNEAIPQDAADRILYLTGLSLPDLNSKLIIDVGSGPRALEKKVREAQITATVVSYDMNYSNLMDSDIKDVTSVQGDAAQGLPFADESADLIVCVGGPLRGGAANGYVPSLYRDAISALKPGGEIRVFQPYRVEEGGIPQLLYDLHTAGKITAPLELIDRIYFDGEPELDLDNVPLPTYPGIDFWLEYYDNLPKKQQQAYAQQLTDELSMLLKDEEPVQVQICEVNPTSESYLPYLIIRKQEDTTAGS